MKDIEASLGRYLAAMDTADRHEPTVAKATTEWLQDKIAALKEQMRILKEVEVQLNDAPDKKVSLTDPPPVDNLRGNTDWRTHPPVKPACRSVRFSGSTLLINGARRTSSTVRRNQA
jgi:hypothetical protein